MSIIKIVCISLFLYLLIFHFVRKWIHEKVVSVNSKMAQEEFYKRCPSAKTYRGKEHRWDPTYNLSHQGLRVYNIPFVPDENEIFYLENKYDEEANLFIQENIELIKDILSSRGLTFVYLPYVKVSREMAQSSLLYRKDGSDRIISDLDLCAGIKSDFLLDYMVFPQNRDNITNGFCWYNTYSELFHYKKRWYTFDYISFDGAEARRHPREVLEDMLPELGTCKIWRKGLHSEVIPESNGLADDNFDEETKNILSEIQEKLNTIRLKGVSEAIIAKYINPCPNLSRITITNNFKIILNDYNNTEIIMEPIVKAVFILFLRHEEGILFKNLSDYQGELEIIYRAIKAKKNDIDAKINSGFTPQISETVKCLANPFNNSINEKCTRVKEAFIMQFHDSIASHYYIQGFRASNKLITIPRNLVVWED